MNTYFEMDNDIDKQKYSVITIFLSPFQRNYNSLYSLHYLLFKRTQVVG